MRVTKVRARFCTRMYRTMCCCAS